MIPVSHVKRDSQGGVESNDGAEELRGKKTKKKKKKKKKKKRRGKKQQ